MADLINLKKIKKRAERNKAAVAAEANRVRFGRTKAQKNADEHNARRAEHFLDQHYLDDGKKS
ncbi:MAG: DUF4169 family protein [Rhizobiales bacterium]|nr:DUF4169 family protein [Hyphomicrobiales bacterium]